MKRQLSIQLFFLLLVLCPVSAQPCSDEAWETIEKITQGDVQTLKDYMDNGGDPSFHCYHGAVSGGHFGGAAYRSIQDAVEMSNSLEIMRTFLSYPLPQSILDDLMSSYSYPESDSLNLITPILIAKGGHVLDPTTFVMVDGEKYIHRLHQLNYDLNWVDSLGNSMIMNIAGSSPDADPKIAIAAIRKLLEIGVRTDLVNIEGHSLKTIPRSGKIRRYIRRNL